MNFYIKYFEFEFVLGQHLLEFDVVNQQLIVVDRKYIQHFVVCFYQESVLCSDILYTFYHQRLESSKGSAVKCISLEKYCILTGETSFILKNVPEDTMINIDGQQYFVRLLPNLFAFHHYEIVEYDEFITDYFFNARSSLFSV